MNCPSATLAHTGFGVVFAVEVAGLLVLAGVTLIICTGPIRERRACTLRPRAAALFAVSVLVLGWQLAASSPALADVGCGSARGPSLTSQGVPVLASPSSPAPRVQNNPAPPPTVGAFPTAPSPSSQAPISPNLIPAEPVGCLATSVFQVSLTTSAPSATVGTALTLTAALLPESDPAAAGDASASQQFTRILFRDQNSVLGFVQLVSGTATLSINTLTVGVHHVTARPDIATDSGCPVHDSNPVSVDVLDGATITPLDIDPQAIQVTVSAGSLSISTPFTPTSPLNLGSLILNGNADELTAQASFGNPGITVTDLRSGDATWSASVQASDLQNSTGAAINGDNLGIVGLRAVPIPGNAVTSADVVLTNHGSPDSPVSLSGSSPGGLTRGPHIFAQTTHHAAGSIGIRATLTLVAPTSAEPGTYVTTLVFTVA